MKWLKPGKDNKEDRMNFVVYWANYVKTHTDEEWSKQQKILIDSQIQNARTSPLSRDKYFAIRGKTSRRL